MQGLIQLCQIFKRLFSIVNTARFVYKLALHLFIYKTPPYDITVAHYWKENNKNPQLTCKQ